MSSTCFTMSGLSNSSDARSAPEPPLDRERNRPHALQIELYRQATPTQKLSTVARMNASAIKLKEGYLEARFPQKTPGERRELLRRWWLGSRD